jgi:cytochrome P450/predicted heme/steroid binding protein
VVLPHYEAFPEPSIAFYWFFTTFPRLVIMPLWDKHLWWFSTFNAVCVSIVFVLLVLKWSAEFREPRWIKQTPALPNRSLWDWFAGTLLGEVRAGTMCRKLMSSKYPGILRVRNGLIGGVFRDLIVVKNPYVAKEILEEKTTKKPDKSYRVFQRLHGYIGGRDFLSFRSHKDEVYARTRGLSYRVLMKRTYDRYVDTYLPLVRSHIKSVGSAPGENLQSRDVVTDMHHIATAVLTSMAFDHSSDNLNQDLFEAVVWMVFDVSDRPQNSGCPYLDKVPTPKNRELWRYQKQLRDAILEVINAKRREPGDGENVVSALLKEFANEPKDSQDETLIGLLSILFFAGFDTTSNTMAMVTYHLAINQDIQDKVREEVNSLFADGPDFAVEKLFKMHYLIAVIKETLRMYPTVPMVSREVTQTHADGVCPRFKEENTTGVVINIFGLHYNPLGWTHPHQFLPERWLDSAIDASVVASERVYAPFALGKRGCFGRQFAYIEMLTVLSHLVHSYNIMPMDSSTPVLKEGGTLLVSGVKCFFEPVRAFALRTSVSGLPTMTMAEVAAHNSKNDAWMVIGGKVYDFTKFVSGDKGGHPGGAEVLLQYAGADGTSEFDFISHSPVATKLLEKYVIGTLAENPEMAPENLSKRQPDPFDGNHAQAQRSASRRSMPRIASDTVLFHSFPDRN